LIISEFKSFLLRRVIHYMYMGIYC